MATSTRCRRATRRYSLPENGTAQVDFDFPSPNGRHYSLPVVDISVSGLSFASSEEIPGLESGTNLPSVSVRIGGCEMHGEILVMHITARGSTRKVVGALFYPAHDADLTKWKSVLAGIEALQAGGRLEEQRESPTLPESAPDAARPETVARPEAGDVADGLERPVDPRWVRVQQLAGGIRSAVFATLGFVAVVIALISASPSRIQTILALAGWLVASLGIVVHGFVWPPVRYRHLRYRIDRTGIRIRSGVWWRSTVSIPESRVQHTDVQQGPIDRAFGLAALIIHTAGTQHASVALVGLERGRALEIRDHLIGADGDA